MNQQALPMLLVTAVAAALAGCGAAPTVQPQAGAPAAAEIVALPVGAKDSGELATPETGRAVARDRLPDKAPEPIAGAFGLALGDRFAPGLVAKVVSEQEYGYRDRDNVQRKGTVYKIEPKLPHEAFSSYLVATTAAGLIYSITGTYADPEKKSRCDLTQRLATELEQRHGKPREQGSPGDWSFRDMSVEKYRGVRLYAPQCRSGRYSIIYSDDGARAGAPPSAAAQPE